jgi:aromatic-amino-acid transaminase
MFNHLEPYAGDPILSLNEAFQHDPRGHKVNLSIGIYFDDAGRIPVLESVRQAEAQLLAGAAPKSYLPIEGGADCRSAVQRLLFGADHEVLRSGRVATLQTIGSSGGLRVGADFLRRWFPASDVWLSDPSWDNHRAIFEGAGVAVHTYPYYDPATGGLRFEAMLDVLRGLPPRSVVLLHACCHNPTGVDPTPEQWDEILAVVRGRGLIPFLDLAYQGFGDGIDADAAVVRKFAATPGPLFISSSFSKSFSLYGERVGACTVVTADKDEAARVLSQLKRVVRANYSNPPTHGGQIVALVMTNPQLREIWEMELGGMRERIREMRESLVKKLKERAPEHDFEFVRRQRGMFSYSGLNRDQVRRLREEFSIYAVDTGRICVAALNSKNVEYVADAVAAVLTQVPVAAPSD